MLALTGGAAPADAASFDCWPHLRYRTCPEVVICSTPELSYLDERVAAARRLLWRRLSRRSRRRLGRSHRRWLDSRDDCGCDAACILYHYENRLYYYEGRLDRLFRR